MKTKHSKLRKLRIPKGIIIDNGRNGACDD
jgi:hypothetical protein